MADLLENKLIDWFGRAQGIGITGATAGVGTGPANLDYALLRAAPSDTGGGTEVAGGSYARVTVASSLVNYAGTQAAASTTASSGTSGTTSNNGAITFPAPSANWGVVTHFGVYDASLVGNLLLWGVLTAEPTHHNGDGGTSMAACAVY